MPWIGRAAAGLAIAWPWLGKFVQKVTGFIAADAAELVLRGTVALVVRSMVIACWGVFLAVVLTGLNGLGIKDFAMQNPFTGVPSGIMYLVSSGFPLHFAFALVQAYIIWKFTYMHAAYIMAKTMKVLFGS